MDRADTHTRAGTVDRADTHTRTGAGTVDRADTRVGGGAGGRTAGKVGQELLAGSGEPRTRPAVTGNLEDRAEVARAGTAGAGSGVTQIGTPSRTANAGLTRIGTPS